MTPRRAAARSALSDLEVLRGRYETLASIAAEAEAQLRAAGGGASLDRRLRNVLAQLHGNCERLVAEGLDALETAVSPRRAPPLSRTLTPSPTQPSVGPGAAVRAAFPQPSSQRTRC